MGRPKTGLQNPNKISSYLSDADFLEFTDLAFEQSRTVADMLRIIIRDYLKSNGGK